MNKKFYLAAVTLAMVSQLSYADGFLNGGFESGTTANWVTGGGYRGDTLNADLSPSMMLPGGSLYDASVDHSAIIAAGTVDPLLGAALGSTVYSGNYSFRAEDTVNGGYASTISQTVSNYSDANIFFAWKAVLENGGHADNESAAMIITLRDDTTGSELLRRTFNAGADGVGVDARFNSEGDLFYTPDWQVEQLTIGPGLAGHDFTLSLMAADCNPTGHVGYAYLDGFGSVAPPVPEPETYGMLLGGLALLGMMARRNKRA